MRVEVDGRVRFHMLLLLFLGVFAIVRAYLLVRGRICARIGLRIRAGARTCALAFVLIVKLFRQYPGFRFHSYIKDVRHGDIANK